MGLNLSPAGEHEVLITADHNKPAAWVGDWLSLAATPPVAALQLITRHYYEREISVAADPALRRAVTMHPWRQHLSGWGRQCFPQTVATVSKPTVDARPPTVGKRWGSGPRPGPFAPWWLTDQGPGALGGQPLATRPPPAHPGARHRIRTRTLVAPSCGGATSNR